MEQDRNQPECSGVAAQEVPELPLAYGPHEEAVRARYPQEYERWGKKLRPLREIEHALQKRFRFGGIAQVTKALKRYDLLQCGDHVAVAISGGKDSLFLAKIFQSLVRFSEVPFTVSFFTMDPGYASDNRRLLEFNCAWLGIPVQIFDSDVFAVAEQLSKGTPCYLCARMRRGFLYARAQEMGCNKVALGHHFNDVIETTLLNVLWSGNYKNMMPKIAARNFKGMELIRPLFFVREQTIIRWRDYSGLCALDCACTVTKREEGSQRKEIKALIARLRETNPNVEHSIFRSGENVALDAILGCLYGGEKHSFLENYGEDTWTFSKS